jgi:hypothetical protein
LTDWRQVVLQPDEAAARIGQPSLRFRMNWGVASDALPAVSVMACAR